ncbi:MAG: phosphoribosylanthranilate isomerase [Rhodospirillales bacterium]|jgi:phosphoribosylanthranilate isomerase|nr:phosphoribosylanthranilate isomerase [Rhodospirillales bacterium]
MKLVKICGLSSQDSVDVSVKNGADMIGFNFFESSPRYVSPAQAGALCGRMPEGVERVGLVVDASDDEIATILAKASLSVLQLHGKETPERVAEVSSRFSLPVMKACAISQGADLDKAAIYQEVAAALLFDAKPPKDATRPGGNAVTFDWTLLKDQKWTCPWLLAGGLTVENVSDALSISGAPGVDLSSGVEDAPGIKNPAKIEAFIAAVKAA